MVGTFFKYRKAGILIFVVSCGLFFTIIWENETGNHLNYNILNPPSKDNQTQLPVPCISGLTPAPPITISGDGLLDACPWKNGSGTWEDPYVFRNLFINGSGSGSCFDISQTQKPFRIENCTTCNSGVSYSGSIELNDVQCATLLNNTVINNQYDGIDVFFSANITIANNTCINNGWQAINIQDSSNMTILRNHCSGNNRGILFSAVNALSFNNIITENNCTNNRLEGIRLSNSCHNITIFRNNCTKNNGPGIVLDYNSYNNTLQENNSSRNVVGIMLGSTTNNNTVFNNWIKKNTQSQLTDNSVNNSVFNNFIVNLPVAAFIANTTIISPGRTIGFTDTTMGGLSPHTYQWNFGDGTSNSTLANPTHTFNSSFYRLERTITLSVTDIEGDNSTYQSSITIASFTGYAHLGDPGRYYINPGQTITLYSEVSNGGKPPFTYQWNFGDGTPNSTAANVTHQYNALGTFTITLTVTDTNGDSFTDSMSITVGLDFPTMFVVIGCIGLAIIIIVGVKRMRKESKDYY